MLFRLVFYFAREFGHFKKEGGGLVFFVFLFEHRKVLCLVVFLAGLKKESGPSGLEGRTKKEGRQKGLRFVFKVA